MPTFVAFVRPDLDNGFAVTFPDLPGLIVFADSPEAAPAAAARGLGKHLAQLRDAGGAIPAPSEPDLLMGGHADGLPIVVTIP
jgi:predicted RNase H-like HicB family nuclease